MKIAQGVRPCGAFIFHILIKSQLKFQFWGPYALTVALMGVKFGMDVGTCQISSPSVQCVALRGEKPQNRPLTKLNTGALGFAQSLK